MENLANVKVLMKLQAALCVMGHVSV